MADHDGGYKLLFAHPRLVEELLRSFVPQRWVERLDFSTLERCEGSYVSERQRRSEQDMVWRVRWSGESQDERKDEAPWLYVYVLLEFQSQVERFMAVRMLVYLGLLYLDLVRREEWTPTGKLPPVLPLVLYNGNPRWSAPKQVSELIDEVPGALEAYRPSLEYLVIDEGEPSEEELASLRGLTALLFRLERSRTPEEIRDKVEALVRELQGTEDASLRRAFGQWLHEVVLPDRFPGEKIPEAGGLEDAQTMLRERVLEWTRQAQEWKEEGLQAGRQQGLQQGIQEGLQQGIQEGRQQGIQEGRQEGRQAGRQEGERRLLLRQLERKFGAVDADARRRIDEADDGQLLAWGESLLTSDRLEDVFSS